MLVKLCDLGFSLREVLSYGFDCFNRHSALQISFLLEAVLSVLVFQGLCSFHLCFRIHRYKIVHMCSPVKMFRICTNVPSLIPDTNNLYLLFFTLNRLEHLLIFLKNQFLFDFSHLFVHFSIPFTSTLIVILSSTYIGLNLLKFKAEA